MTAKRMDKKIGRPFQKGQVANPAGRPRGIPDRRTQYREMIESRMPELLETCVKLALQGDLQALRLCLERVLPAARVGDELVSLPVHGTLSQQAQQLMQATFNGEVAPSAAATFMSTLAAQARIVEVDELARRVEALERNGASAVR
jgi:hypothetical protein